MTFCKSHDRIRQVKWLFSKYLWAANYLAGCVKFAVYIKSFLLTVALYPFTRKSKKLHGKKRSKKTIRWFSSWIIGFSAHLRAREEGEHKIQACISTYIPVMGEVLARSCLSSATYFSTILYLTIQYSLFTLLCTWQLNKVMKYIWKKGLKRLKWFAYNNLSNRICIFHA